MAETRAFPRPPAGFIRLILSRSAQLVVDKLTEALSSKKVIAKYYRFATHPSRWFRRATTLLGEGDTSVREMGAVLLQTARIVQAEHFVRLTDTRARRSQLLLFDQAAMASTHA